MNLWRIWAHAIRPRERLDPAEWAARYRYLTAAESSKPGQWDNAYIPAAVEPMQRMSPFDPCPRVVLMFCSQFIKTEILNNIIGYYTHWFPRRVMLVMPTIDMAEKHSKLRIAPMYTSPAFQGIIAAPRSRDSGNTLTLKEFPSGALLTTGSNSGSQLASWPMAVLLCDEIKDWQDSVSQQGSPLHIVRIRLSSHGDRAKEMDTSTPGVKGTCPIEREFSFSSRAEFEVPCPQCGKFETWKWPGLRYDGDPKRPGFRVWYECGKCGHHIEEHEKATIFPLGRWVHADPDNPVKGYHINALYMPPGRTTWRKLVEEFNEANERAKQGDSTLLQVFVNTRLAETWEDVGVGEVPVNALLSRREPWPDDAIPNGILVLTCGVDVHDDRLDCHLVGWGLHGERWTVDYRIIPGGPIPDEQGRYDWDYLDDLRHETFRRADGMQLPITITLIDLGGHRTDEAYRYTRSKSPHQVVGCFGRDDSTALRPVVERQARRDEKRQNAHYRIVGTDPAKTAVFRAMRTWDVKSPGGPGTWHFPMRDWCDEEWFKQLTGEHAVTITTKRGRQRRIYVQHRHDNHVLDTSVLGYAGFRVLEIEGRLRRLMAAPTSDPLPRGRLPKPETPVPPSPIKDQAKPVDNESEDVGSLSAPPSRIRGRWHGGSDPRRD